MGINGGRNQRGIEGNPEEEGLYQRVNVSLPPSILKRLDKYMKVSRIIKRRTVANEAASAGRISVNGRTAKPSSDVKPGDEIDILLGGKHFVVRVENVQETVRKEDAAGMYTVLREARDSEDR